MSCPWLGDSALKKTFFKCKLVCKIKHLIQSAKGIVLTWWNDSKNSERKTWPIKDQEFSEK